MDQLSNLLHVNPDVIQRLVDLARQINSRDFTDISGGPELELGGTEVMTLSEQHFDSTADEFRSIIDDLDPEQQQQVVALFRLGRGDYGIDEWADAVAVAREDWNESTADYLLGHPLLADYLANGMISHGYDVE